MPDTDFQLACRVLAGATLPSNEALRPDRFDALLRLCEDEAVLPALHAAVAGAAPPWPRPYRAVLAVAHEANRRRNAELQGVLRTLGRAGAERGLSLVALKGAAWLLEDASHAAPWRWMLDLDLLVDPARYDEIPSLLDALGYRRASSASRFRGNFHHAPYAHPSVPVTVEVHRHLGWRHGLLPAEILLADAAPLGEGLLLPSPWCRAFHAVIHWQIQDCGLQRGTTRLKEVLEVERFLRRDDVDWDRLAAHAREVRASGAVDAAVALAATLLAAPVPRPLSPGDAATRHVARALRRRASPLRTRIATERWRAGTLWRCEKLAYRLWLRGLPPALNRAAVWGLRMVQLPVLAVRLGGAAARIGWSALRQERMKRR